MENFIKSYGFFISAITFLIANTSVLFLQYFTPLVLVLILQICFLISLRILMIVFLSSFVYFFCVVYLHSLCFSKVVLFLLCIGHYSSL